MQKRYISALYEIMCKDSRVCSLLSDSGTDYDIMMARDLPDQCFNFGISEQNQVGAASGMAAMGKIPFVYTTGAFLAYRAYEFIRDDVCFQNRNVKIVGMGMGISGWSTLGTSHHTTEDIAALRALPNLIVLSASTPFELTQMVEFAYHHEGPVYIRMGMSGEEELLPEEYRFEIGKVTRILEGQNDIAVFTTGTLSAEVYHACELLNAECYLVSSIKPVNCDDILCAVSGKRKVFSVEEHQIRNGIGSLVAEVMAESGVGVPLVRLGLDNEFAHGYGTSAQIRKMNGLDRASICSRIQARL